MCSTQLLLSWATFTNSSIISSILIRLTWFRWHWNCHLLLYSYYSSSNPKVLASTSTGDMSVIRCPINLKPNGFLHLFVTYNFYEYHIFQFHHLLVRFLLKAWRSPTVVAPNSIFVLFAGSYLCHLTSIWYQTKGIFYSSCLLQTSWRSHSLNPTLLDRNR